jgi:hypothetical protein
MSKVGLTLGGAVADGASFIGLLNSYRILIANVVDSLSPPNKAPVSATLTATLISHDVRARCQGSLYVSAILLAPEIAQK